MPDYGDLGLRSIDERVTRFLCATAHLDASFANHVWAVLLSPGRQAQAPEAEIDPIALARHAMLSLSRRKERDRQLAVVLLGVLTAGVALFVLAAKEALSMSQAALLVCLLPVAGWLIALLIVFSHYRLVRDSAVEVFSGRELARVSAPPLDPEDELRLWRLHWENVVIYNRFSPFVGTGHTVDSWRVNLHTNPPNAARSLGHAGRGFHISPAQVHEYLLEHVPEVLGRVPGRTEDDDARYRVTAERRLYIDGGTASSIRNLVDGGPIDIIPPGQDHETAKRPATRASNRTLDWYTEHPNRTARTYCCFVENSGNGDVVVTVLVRAEMVGDTLWVEGRSQVLLPVQAGFKDVYWVNKRDDEATMPVLRAALPRTTGLWLESPLRLYKLSYGDWHDARTLREEGLRIERGQPVNYGAGSSLREDASLPSDPGFYGAMDEVMYFRTITQQIFECLYDLLAKHGITSPDLEQQRRLLVEDVLNVEGVRNAGPHGSDNVAL